MAANDADELESQPVCNKYRGLLYETTKLLSPVTPSLYRSISQSAQREVFLPPEQNTDGDRNNDDEGCPKRRPWASLSILMLGVFVSQLDSSLVLATYGQVASEFGELASGSWLISAYLLAQCAAQPLYGKLSDIYGRKSCLLVAYILFAVGTAGVGISRTMGEVIAWRAVEGMGGAGMVSVVSIIITDIVPKHEVAATRSYVNVLQTAGRSCGGVVGGFLTQAVGWRWAFLVQVLPTLIAVALVAHLLELPASTSSSTDSRWKKFKRVDFVGAFFLTLTILAICLILDLGGQRVPWTSPWVYALVATGSATGIAFIISAKVVEEPIFPLALLTDLNVVANYAVILLGMASQVSLMAAVPVYFQAVAQVSTAAAGAYLIPAFVGNTLGGLLAGYWIRRTGRYKLATVLAPLLSLFCMTLLFLTWNGHTSTAESLFIFPSGFAMGVIQSSAFIGLIAGLSEEHVAVAASGMYLFLNMGAIAGVSCGSAVSDASVRSSLETSLKYFPEKDKIIKHALSDLHYIRDVKSVDLRHLLKLAYTQGFHAVNVLGIVYSVLGFFFATSSTETSIKKGK